MAFAREGTISMRGARVVLVLPDGTAHTVVKFDAVDPGPHGKPAEAGLVIDAGDPDGIMDADSLMTDLVITARQVANRGR